METQEEKEVVKEEKKKESCLDFCKRVFSKKSYSDDKVYRFNMSVFIGSSILIFFGMILFFCF